MSIEFITLFNKGEIKWQELETIKVLGRKH
jgi:hypothetical protein